ncbi:hypothetical protein B566_EDAN000950 [Ephemera danica]|nr:hypothetical protein B566_EDAN000950 [Ephemera danica]
MQHRPQEWSLHAQVTISHSGAPPGASATASCQPCTSGTDSGVRMEYSLKAYPPPSFPEPSSGYGFQRGNILFTTRPPPRGTRSHSFHYTGPSSSSSSGSTQQPRAATLGRSDLQAPRQDSGYNSEQLSPHSYYGSLPSRPTRQSPQPYNRRCMSTYSIVLADARNVPLRPPEISPVPEVCEECAKSCSPRTRSPHTFSSHFCTHLPGKNKGQLKDAASQTTAEPTSPKPTGQPRMGSKAYNTRRKTDSDASASLLLQVPTLMLPEPEDNDDKPRPSRRLTRSPARLGGKSPLLQRRTAAARDSLDSNSSSQSGCKQSVRGRPRTVHIDVYCTGSEEDADASDNSTSSASTTCSSNTTTPQTVYESDKLRVVHARPKKHELPLALARKQPLSRKSESFKYTSVERDVDARGYDSDDATLSSLYPSRSSFDSVEISLPGGPPTRDASWSTLSSSTLLFEDDTSSWKDTTESGPDLPESSLAQSDSFEYADSVDRLRIQEKEQAWSRLHSRRLAESVDSKTWKSPESERRQMIQRQRFQEFLTKHLNKAPSWSVQSTTSSDMTSEDGFGLTRGDTVRRASSSRQFPEISDSSRSVPSVLVSDLGSLSDSNPQPSHIHDTIGPFGRRPPSPPLSKLKSKITSPFTTPQGIKTAQQLKAEKFGPIVGSLKKPGNHIGPSKNPECGCEHCRRFYEDSGFRGRACSVGDVPRGSWQDTVEQVASSGSDSQLGQQS